MATSDALIVGEDWISEYYFTTDAKSQSFGAKVADRRKQWDADAQAVRDDGDAASKPDTVRTRFTAARAGLASVYANVVPDADEPVAEDPRLPDLYGRLRTILGYHSGEFTLKQSGPVISVSTPDLAEAAPLIIVEARSTATIEDLLERNGSTLLTPYQPDDTVEITSVSRLLSAFFVAEDGPSFALVMAGKWLLVAERTRWAEGRYLAVDFQLICDRNDDKRGGEVDRALACVGAESLAPDAEGGIWWTKVFDDSVHHTAEVTGKLRVGIRLSIEIIANEVVRRRQAAGLDPLPQSQAQPLARQALRYLYRILFLLYAEASPELKVLPAGAEEYDQGYGLDRLRELILVELTSPNAMTGTHFYDSLALLFHLVDRGHEPPAKQDGEADGLVFNHLRADLFKPEATGLIDAVGLGNTALQQVLRHLLLSEEAKGRDRGFISYATLGINQLGEVYEGLMSYTGFFAEEDLHEVAKGGDPAKGSWVVPVRRSGHLDPGDFVRYEDEVTGEKKAVIHHRGEFVYRLAGRERQQSASYYTPEVLTRFTVSQALEELLDQDGQTTKADQILDLTVCEPAMGSGAFAIEAVQQLAEQYLRRKQAEERELGRPGIEPDAYPTELQRVKAHIALHQVYGVDLNETAVEFAEISLWLSTMSAGLQAPWFGLRLKRGNSLIGARRAVYTRAQVNDKSWLTETPVDVPMTGMVEEMVAETVAAQTDGRIHHFLLPAEGWGAAVQAKEAVALALENAATLRKWRSGIRSKPSVKHLNALAELSHRVEALWQITLRRLQIAESEARRDIKLWGHNDPGHTQAVTREEIEATLKNPNGAYQRLRRVMDAWGALWFWPLTDTTVTAIDNSSVVTTPPTMDQWIDACQKILGREPEVRKKFHGMTPLGSAANWEDLNASEEMNLDFSGAAPIAKVLEDHPWLKTCAAISDRQGFFHWELDFATVFAGGGFDLQVGNPPWVKPRAKVDALLAEGDPWWQLAHKPSEAEKEAKREITMMLPGIRDLVVGGSADVVVTAEYMGSVQAYPLLTGLQPDLYRCFMTQAWKCTSSTGIVALNHLETHFTDENAKVLREHTYSRLRRHWQFNNELKLYDIGHQKTYGVNVYGSRRSSIQFLTASSLYHPDTVERSMKHDGSGSEPGIKDLDGKWDRRPHRGRVVSVVDETLKTWHEFMENESVPIRQTRMVYAVNRAASDVLVNMSRQSRASVLNLNFSPGWHEKNDRAKKRFELRWGAPRSWGDVILQGPHLFVANPVYKSPNVTMKDKSDWSFMDLEKLASGEIPVTSYKPIGGSGYPRDFYRVAWRRRAANAGERTLIPAIIPPGAAHVHPVSSAWVAGDVQLMCVASGFMSSLVSDFSVRSSPKEDINLSAINRLPLVVGHRLQAALVIRTLRLNCIVDAYVDLWRAVYDADFAADQWASGRLRANRPELGVVTSEWTAVTPLRIAEDRRQALVEIDALVALMLGITADQLCTIYRTQFPVLYGYDHNSYVYDAKGRLVPSEVLSVWRKKGDAISGAERTATNASGHTYIYELPFTLLDREKDMREAYAEFERRLAAM